MKALIKLYNILINENLTILGGIINVEVNFRGIRITSLGIS